MALETVVFQQDPFGCGCAGDFSLCHGPLIHGVFGVQGEEVNHHHQTVLSTTTTTGYGFNFAASNHLEYYYSSLSLMGQSVNDQYDATIGFSPLASTVGQRKRRRSRSVRNQEEVERQRMTHIKVERNRRKQMKDYLSVLRSMMPPSYVQRGDQSSIVGGAINFVKELEQLLQSLEAKKQSKANSSCLFSNFFTFPQYSTLPNQQNNNSHKNSRDEHQSPAIADVEVTMVESHANLKVLSRKHPKQLLKMVAGLCSMGLNILHLNATTVDDMVLYSFSLKVENNECQVNSVNGIAAAVYELVCRIHQELNSNFSCDY